MRQQLGSRVQCRAANWGAQRWCWQREAYATLRRSIHRSLEFLRLGDDIAQHEICIWTNWTWLLLHLLLLW